MTDAAAFQATVHGFRTVPTRKVVQVTIEAPIEQHARIAAIAEHGAWVAVARLQAGSSSGKTAASNTADEGSIPSQAAKDRKPWNTLPPTMQAGIRCADPIFQAYVVEEKNFNEVPDDLEKNAACWVRGECKVNTRGALSTNSWAGSKWQLIDNDYLQWKYTEGMV